jgi:hypothetical protein
MIYNPIKVVKKAKEPSETKKNLEWYRTLTNKIRMTRVLSMLPSHKKQRNNKLKLRLYLSLKKIQQTLLLLQKNKLRPCSQHMSKNPSSQHHKNQKLKRLKPIMYLIRFKRKLLPRINKLKSYSKSQVSSHSPCIRNSMSSSEVKKKSEKCKRHLEKILFFKLRVI